MSEEILLTETNFCRETIENHEEGCVKHRLYIKDPNTGKFYQHSFCTFSVRDLETMLALAKIQ